MSNPCELPPCPPCPPPPPPPCPPPCPQVCPPPPPVPPCRVKPIMRGLHWAQTKRKIAEAFILAAIGGAAYHFLVAAPRKAAYADFHARGVVDEWAEEMDKKGIFQSVPRQSAQDKKPKNNK